VLPLCPYVEPDVEPVLPLALPELPLLSLGVEAELPLEPCPCVDAVAEVPVDWPPIEPWAEP
jgi:hypothetical protein